VLRSRSLSLSLLLRGLLLCSLLLCSLLLCSLLLRGLLLRGLLLRSLFLRSLFLRSLLLRSLLLRSLLLRRSRLPSRLYLRFVSLDVVFDRNSRDRITDHFERNVFQFLETDTRLAHVEFLAGLQPGDSELGLLLFRAVDAHQVDRQVVLLRRETRKGKRLRSIAVISGRVDLVRNEPTDHPVLDALDESFVQILVHHLAHCL